jgi:hypothetical protein
MEAASGALPVTAKLHCGPSLRDLDRSIPLRNHGNIVHHMGRGPRSKTARCRTGGCLAVPSFSGGGNRHSFG